MAPLQRAMYLDASATTPPAGAVLEAMAAAQATAWANPSSLHGYGLAAAELLERSRWRTAELLGCRPEELIYTSGGTESIHLALLGLAASRPRGRALISSIEHPATVAAAAQLERQGWRVERLPVNRQGLLDPGVLADALVTPTALVSLIWGQSEVGTLQPIALLGQVCRRAGALLHVDAVQVVGQQTVDFAALPVDLLSLAAHKFQGPRGIGALLVRQGTPLQPLLAGGGQEWGLRAGTEPVALAAGLARALELRMADEPQRAATEALRDALLQQLRPLAGLQLSGTDPLRDRTHRLPHHISLLVGDRTGRPLSGRALVRELWREGYAVSSGSACSSSGSSASAVLLALGYSAAEAASGLRISLGPWLSGTDLAGFPSALDRVRERLSPNP